MPHIGIEALPRTPARSVSEALKRGINVKPVRITPSEFSWKNHNYKVHEAWYEAPPKPGSVPSNEPEPNYAGYAFSFEIDGKYPRLRPKFGSQLDCRENYGCTSGADGDVYWLEDYERKRTQIVLHIIERYSGSFNVNDPPQPGEPAVIIQVSEN